jgi:hypothetical protein
MCAYKPDQRSVPVRAVTTAGILAGTMHVARAHMLLDHVNHAKEMLNLTDVQVRDAKTRIPFFSLRRGQTLAIVPPADDDLEDATGKNYVAHEIVCLAAAGSIAGRLEILPNVRVSDYLQGQSGFFLLSRATLQLPGVNLPNAQVAVVLVNASLVVGVTEMPR